MPVSNHGAHLTPLLNTEETTQEYVLIPLKCHKIGSVLNFAQHLPGQTLKQIQFLGIWKGSKHHYSCKSFFWISNCAVSTENMNNIAVSNLLFKTECLLITLDYSSLPRNFNPAWGPWSYQIQISWVGCLDENSKESHKSQLLSQN